MVASCKTILQATPNVKPELLQLLTALFTQALREAVNLQNERGYTALDSVLQCGLYEIADAFVSLFGKHLELDCGQGLLKTPKSEICVIVPGNLQVGGHIDP